MYTNRLPHFTPPALDLPDHRGGPGTPDLYERIGRAAVALLDARRQGRTASVDALLVQFAEGERLLARECLETAALILDCEIREAPWGEP